MTNSRQTISTLAIIAAAVIAISVMTPGMEAFAATFNGPQASKSISTPITSGVTFGPGSVACTYTVTVTQDSTTVNKFYVKWNSVPATCNDGNGHNGNLSTMRTLVQYPQGSNVIVDISPPATQTTVTLPGFVQGSGINVTVETYYSY